MLSVRGQVDIEHYEGRVRIVLEPVSYRLALELLTEAAVNKGLLTNASIDRYRRFVSKPANRLSISDEIEDVLHLLEHDG